MAERASQGDWVEQLARDYQDRITCGLYRGVRELEPEALSRVMDRQAQACVDAFLRLRGLADDLPFDDFLEAMQTSGPSPIRIERRGDEMLWTELHDGQCACPFVRRGVIELDASLCVCAVHWVRRLVERYAHRPADVELVESVARGAGNCTFRVRLRREEA